MDNYLTSITWDEFGVTIILKPNKVVAHRVFKHIKLHKFSWKETFSNKSCCCFCCKLFFHASTCEIIFFQDARIGTDEDKFHKVYQLFSGLWKPTCAFLLDNHDSYLSIKALKLFKENVVVVILFPSHCSHKLQPLAALHQYSRRCSDDK